MTKNDWLDLTVLERQKYNHLSELMDLTRQLGEAIDRGDEVSVRILVSMRNDPLVGLEELKKATRLRTEALSREERERVEGEHSAQRKSQVGSGMRNERIRTYNFPQGRLTDHRVNLTLYKLDAVMNGTIDEIIDTLVTADQAAKLEAETQ